MLDSPNNASFRLGQFSMAFLLFWLVWLLLVGSLARDELIAGAVVAAVTALISRPYLHLLDALRLSPSALLSLLRYLGYFFIALLRANVDLAYRVLSPSLPINPGMIEIRTRLASPLARMLLANSITLTPGTLTVDMDGDRLLIHCVNCPDQDADDLKHGISASVRQFEKHIGGFLR